MKTVFESMEDAPIGTPATETAQAAPGGAIWDVLKTPTGGGSVQQYIEHPLNVPRSEGIAQTIRGVTGFLGDTSYAIVDILFGLIRFAWERRAKNA